MSDPIKMPTYAEMQRLTREAERMRARALADAVRATVRLPVRLGSALRRAAHI